MGSLFKSKSRATSTKQPYESTEKQDLTRDTEAQRTLNELQKLQQTVSGTQGVTGTQTTDTTGRSGLADTALLAPLKAALSKADLSTATPEIDALLGDRQRDNLLAGYTTARQEAIEDYGDAVRTIGHYGAQSRRDGDARDRALRIAQDQLSKNLFRGYDTSRREHEQAVEGLVDARQRQGYANLGRYSNLLATTPFERIDRKAGKQATQEDTQRKEVTDETLERSLSEQVLEKLKQLGVIDKKGFTTHTAVNNDPSKLLQLASFAAGVGSLFSSGSAKVDAGGKT